MSEEVSRRGLFGRLLGRASEAPPAASPPAPPAPEARPAGPSPAPSGRPKPGPMRPGKAGTFAIANHLCLAWKGTTCSTCREKCPVPGAVVIDLGKPTIDATLCTGCGDCVAVCPASILAIRFVPQKPAP